MYPLGSELPSEIQDEESEMCRFILSSELFSPGEDFLPDLHFDQANIN